MRTCVTSGAGAGLSTNRFDERFISKIECFLKSRHNDDFSLRGDSLHCLPEAGTFFLHEEFADHGCRPTLTTVTMHQHRRMLCLELLEQSNCAQKNLRPVARSINKLHYLDLIDAKGIRFHSKKAPSRQRTERILSRRNKSRSLASVEEPIQMSSVIRSMVTQRTTSSSSNLVFGRGKPRPRQHRTSTERSPAHPKDIQIART